MAGPDHQVPAGQAGGRRARGHGGNRGAAKRSNGKCPSAFFIGMDALRRGDKQRAREQLQLTQARCPTISELNWAATSELKRL